MAKRSQQPVTPSSSQDSSSQEPEPAAPPNGAAPPLELLADTPDAPTRPGELEASLRDPSEVPPGEPSSASSASSEAPGAQGADVPKRPGFQKWSKSRIKNATRKEMASRLQELEAIAEVTPVKEGAPGAPEASQGIPLEALEKIATDALGRTLGVVSDVGARMRGEHWRLKPEERDALAGAWAPILAPYLVNAGAWLPWVAALSVTGSIVWPRVERDMQLQKMAQAEPLSVSVDRPTGPAE